MLRLRIGTFPSLMLMLMGSMDCLTTVIGIAYFGAIECNPLMSGIISINLPAFVALKLITTAVVCLIFIQAEKILMKTQNKNTRAFATTKRILRVAFVGTIAFLAIVVTNNLIVLVTAF